MLLNPTPFVLVCVIKRTHPIKIIQNLMEENPEAPKVPKKKETHLLFDELTKFLEDLIKDGGTDPHSSTGTIRQTSIISIFYLMICRFEDREDKERRRTKRNN